MAGMTQPRKNALLMGFAGLLVIFLGVKYTLQRGVSPAAFLGQHQQPVLLFFSIDEPCECMKKTVGNAEAQINAWPVENRAGLVIQPFDRDTNQELANQYDVAIAPALLLLDEHGEVYYRQDPPLSEDQPFDLAAFEAEIRILNYKK